MKTYWICIVSQIIGWGILIPAMIQGLNTYFIPSMFFVGGTIAYFIINHQENKKQKTLSQSGKREQN